jgi:hypothetical protein
MSPSPSLSKSKLLAYRQCPRRLWLEVHHPELREDSASARAKFAVGNQIGDLARQLYDPGHQGTLFNPQQDGFDTVFQQTQERLHHDQPLFEAGFRAAGAHAFADVMLPVHEGDRRAWRMVEVKSSASVKPYHHDDAAIQAFIARAAGVPLSGVAVAHIDSQWTYAGDGNYQGLLVEHDLTAETAGREDEVRGWIAQAQAVASTAQLPPMETGRQCFEPFECGFLDHCRSQEPPVEYPVYWLPGTTPEGVRDMRDIPPTALSAQQRRVRDVTLSGQLQFDQPGAAAKLAKYPYPAYFMDFETIQHAVPKWKGARPYRQTPFQFSLHRLDQLGDLTHREFLDLSGDDPSRAFAEALIAACGDSGPIFVYSGFENGRLRELTANFPDLAADLQAIIQRVVDLCPIARAHYCHPSQHGSWSIKAILPAAFPGDQGYAQLDGVKDGGMAMQAYLEATADQTSAERKAEIRRQLLAYCKLDTEAMLRLWALFTGTPVEI